MNNEDFRPSRRALLGVFAGLCAVAAAPVYAKAPGFLRKAGDVRRVRMYSQRTGEVDRHDLLRRRPLRSGIAE